MTKMTAAPDTALDNSTGELDFGRLLFDGLLSSSTSTQVVGQVDGDGFVIDGEGFGKMDASSWPTQGVIHAITLLHGSEPATVISGMDIDVAAFRALQEIGDVRGFSDLLFGSKDQITGAGLADRMFGYGGDDRLDGQAGKDRLTGGFGADTLTGGAGKDQFIFNSAGESTASDRDVILDLNDRDIIQLSHIDADRFADGDQAFHIVDHLGNHRAELCVTYDADKDITWIRGDQDGDGAADLVIEVRGDHADFTHFVL